MLWLKNKVIEEFILISPIYNYWTIIGKVHGSEVTITSCFPVNHSDNKDNVQLDMSYARKRAELELKAKPHEAIVGWFVFIYMKF